MYLGELFGYFSTDFNNRSFYLYFYNRTFKKKFFITSNNDFNQLITILNETFLRINRLMVCNFVSIYINIAIYAKTKQYYINNFYMTAVGDLGATTLRI